MDSLITAAARALASGDPLGALNHVALREDPPALALRGIAMAQLGDLARARELLRRAGRAFGAKEAVARARCTVAEAEIALVLRDLGWRPEALESARAVLEQHGDRTNAAHAAYLQARLLLLIGRLDEAEQTVSSVPPALLPLASAVGLNLVVAGVAMRRLRTEAARQAVAEAGGLARRAAIPSVMAEVEVAAHALGSPAGRLIARGEARLLRLEEVEALLASDALVIDACRLVVRSGGDVVSLASRPVLFALARTLAEAWPADVSRETLLAKAFRARVADESHRARLRVEIGRLRTELQTFAAVSATPRGFALEPKSGKDPVVLAPPADEQYGAILALLADGEAWSSSALGIALGTSQRTVQRALDALAEDGKVRAVGRGRARRWLAPSVPGFPTTLLLPAPLPSG